MCKYCLGLTFFWLTTSVFILNLLLFSFYLTIKFHVGLTYLFLLTTTYYLIVFKLKDVKLSGTLSTLITITVLYYWGFSSDLVTLTNVLNEILFTIRIF